MYGLIGKKLGHSFSADFFNTKFEREGIDNSYHLLPIDKIEDFPSLLDSHKDLQGLNVTIPYKKEIIRYLDALSDEAREIGAVNVIKFEEKNGKRFLVGHNSDIKGFENSLLPLLRSDITKALVLGTGGASQAVVFVLNKLGLKVTLVSRSPQENQLSYQDLSPEIIKDNLLIVNTTPLGMFPDTEGFPPIPYHNLTPKHLCYDLVYNPETTAFMKKAKEYGAKVKNGLEMLEGQAIAAWDIWTK